MLTGAPYTVIGAGIAGLAVATALAQRGAIVQVLEQAETISEVGAGLQISPNGAAVLAALGLGAALRADSLVSKAVQLKDYRRGAPVLRLDLAKHYHGPLGFHLIHRAALIAILETAARAAGVDIQTGAPATPERLQGLVIGADGVKSATRAMLNPASKPFFTGQVAWRAVIKDTAPSEAQVYMGPGKHLVTYPLSGGLRNIVAVQERKTWAEEGWSHPDDPQNLRAAFADFAPEVQDWLSRIKTPHIWGLFRHDVAQTWFDERHVILGDAAHPTLPFLAQGANLALEDAWVLADCLANHPPPEAFGRYQSKRHARVTRTITAANKNARNYHLRNPLLRSTAHMSLRLGGKLAPKAPLNAFKWLYDHDVTRA